VLRFQDSFIRIHIVSLVQSSTGPDTDQEANHQFLKFTNTATTIQYINTIIVEDLHVLVSEFLCGVLISNYLKRRLQIRNYHNGCGYDLMK